MKNHKLYILCILLGAMLLSACSIGTDIMCSTNKKTSEPYTASSSVSFFAEKGDKIRCDVVTVTKQGRVTFAIYDSNDNIIQDWVSADKLKSYITPEYDDEYKFRIHYDEFVGQVKSRI